MRESMAQIPCRTDVGTFKILSVGILKTPSPPPECPRFPDPYRTLELPGKNPHRGAHAALDAAVRAAYGMKAKDDPLAFLLALNKEVVARGGG